MALGPQGVLGAGKSQPGRIRKGPPPHAKGPPRRRGVLNRSCDRSVPRRGLEIRDSSEPEVLGGDWGRGVAADAGPRRTFHALSTAAVDHTSRVPPVWQVGKGRASLMIRGLARAGVGGALVAQNVGGLVDDGTMHTGRRRQRRAHRLRQASDDGHWRQTDEAGRSSARRRLRCAVAANACTRPASREFRGRSFEPVLRDRPLPAGRVTPRAGRGSIRHRGDGRRARGRVRPRVGRDVSRGSCGAASGQGVRLHHL